ncbi:MAG: Periplasmic dipeptide transport protein [Paracidovorax wautersii]|uniref:Periplasmic dipeptide transport protein n=1 Tax=Paracidovorax wautersii TaxID=1177982 RepID=A0A7V8JPR0_9BURK|nr:MAG: Periplasmic dipeptide transport protein [Paracidovorax wautersii]
MTRIQPLNFDWISVLNRRHLLASAAAATALPFTPALQAQPRGKDTLVVGLVLEPAGLDPTAKAGAEIAEVVLYNVFETLTKIQSDGSVAPLLAERWEVSPDRRTYTFHLRRDARFHNGQPFNAQAVKFSFDRAKAEDSTNKDRPLFAQLSTEVAGDYTVTVTSQTPEPNLPFLLGQASAIVVEPASAAGNATAPVGTGPYQLQAWNKGASVVLAKWDGWREAGRVALRRVTFRIISDPAAQTAALLAGDIDLFPHASVWRALSQFQGDGRFQVVFNASLGKTILAINQRRQPLGDVRVRRAIQAAIDRKAVIEAASEGHGVPIGSHYVPGLPGYVDTTGLNPYDPAKARQLLAEAGVKTPLALSLVLPPPAYARQGGEVIAAQLAQVGIRAQLQNVEWAQWIGNVYGGARNYDLTMILHVEPFDLGNYAKPDYYWGYRSARFDALYERTRSAPTDAERLRALADAQRLLADDAANGFLYQPQFVTVAARGLRGLWKDAPIFANDLSALAWG